MHIVDFGTAAQIGRGIFVNDVASAHRRNRIGVDSSGDAARNNDDGSVSNADGTRSTARAVQERNLISDNRFGGVVLLGSTANTTITGNIFGLGPGGNAALGIQSSGVNENAGVTGTVIGGLTAAETNTASGNTVAGLEVQTRGCSATASAPTSPARRRSPTATAGSRQAGRRTSAAPRPVTAT